MKIAFRLERTGETRVSECMLPAVQVCCRPVGCRNSTRTKVQKGVSERHKSVRHSRIYFHLSKFCPGHSQATITKPSEQYFALFCRLCDCGLKMQWRCLSEDKFVCV